MGNKTSTPQSLGTPSSPTCPAVEQPSSQQQGDTDLQGSSACPVVSSNQSTYKNPAVYNVYGQRINDPNSAANQNPLAGLKNADVLDPRNNMPLEPNQMPCPGQRKPLSTERVASTIPKGGTDSTWLFPSPQMVFNGEQAYWHCIHMLYRYVVDVFRELAKTVLLCARISANS